MSKKYSPPDSDYSGFCKIPNCEERTVVCKLCGHRGHPTVYKHGKKNMVPQVAHGHFLPSIDIGRNVNHRVGKPVFCPKEMRVYTWRLPQEYQRWLRIPEEQKKNWWG